MDDLLGEDWQTSSKASASNLPLNPSIFASTHSGLRGSPALSLTSNPSSRNVSRPSSTLNGGPKPGSDQFGNLLALKSQKAAGSNVSIQERQKQLLEEKRRQQEQQSQAWDQLGSGRGTPEVRGPSPVILQQDDEDDALVAFNRVARSETFSRGSTPAQGESHPAQAASIGGFDDDDDPFDLKSVSKKTNGHAKAAVPTQSPDDDDILGDLGRPMMQKPSPREATPTLVVKHDFDAHVEGDPPEAAPLDRGVAELVEMGFPADTAKTALDESGGDVQNAVGWLLQQAHEESKQKSQKARGEAPGRVRISGASSRSPPRRPRGEEDAMPSWMRDEARPNSAARRQDSRSPAVVEKDATQVAQELGSKFLKGANSLWKASQKQMAKTVAEFQQERDSSQPKWMQDVQPESSNSTSHRRQPEKPTQRVATAREADVTNEAAMLDVPRERPQRPTRPSPVERSTDSPIRGRSPVESVVHRPASIQPRFTQHAPPFQEKRPASKLSRQDVEDQSAQAYTSPARRKRPTPRPEPTPEPEVDLFSPLPAKAATAPPPKSTPVPSASRPLPTAPNPKAPPRTIPPISPSALSTSASHRKAGSEAYKRGDYVSAHESYTTALTPLPPTHPIAIIVLSNRSLTALKTGDAKTAVADADRALALIGPGLGIGETINPGAGEGAKEMRDFYAKALARKAEALEHLEKWPDAAAVWRTAVEAGVGGAVALRGRDRCEKAAAPKAAKLSTRATTPAAPAARHPPVPKSLGNTLTRPTLPSASSGAAVQALRAANLAAERADDEKFSLTDAVDARLTAWRGGKADNLRALLSTLESVLWAGAGWKKVGMAELVVPGKVKVVYMRAIGRCHPDKIPQDATMEQRMISGAVFSALNEAWDKFKRDNNL